MTEQIAGANRSFALRVDNLLQKARQRRALRCVGTAATFVRGRARGLQFTALGAHDKRIPKTHRMMSGKAEFRVVFTNI